MLGSKLLKFPFLFFVLEQKNANIRYSIDYVMSEVDKTLSWMGLNRLRGDLERQIAKAKQEGQNTEILEQRLAAVKHSMER
jgi:hypothetical protein